MGYSMFWLSLCYVVYICQNLYSDDPKYVLFTIKESEAEKD